MMVFAATVSATCVAGLGSTADASRIVAAYNARSLEILRLAAAGADQELSELVAPDAEFSLGSGDVGRPLGRGLTGATAMLADLQGTVPGYFATTELHPSTDPCADHNSTIEYVTPEGTRSAMITFHYSRGKLQSAAGWWRSTGTRS